MLIHTVALAVILIGIPLSNGATPKSLEELQEDFDNLVASQRALIRQNILQDLYLDEKTRSEGDSGVKQIRSNRVGTRPYYSETHSGNSIMAIHDHAEFIRTIGMGEFAAVLNGLEFRTRHNDYGLRMPSTTTNQYHRVEDIPFPDVPESVKQFTSVDKQVEEMRKYFEAWTKQDTKIRDYKPYFKPALCYLEGAWTKSVGSIEESFESDRHFIDAKNWYDLEEKIRFNAYSGTKDNLENFAYLPKKIVGMDGTFPEMAQYNYRILCHPLKEDLPLDRLRVVDDLSSRIAQGNGRSVEDYTNSRVARFSLALRKTGAFTDGSQTYPTLLDQLMAEIPGKDNYGTVLTDDAWGMKTFNRLDNKVLNAANYHRFFKVQHADAMGSQTRKRSYSDANVFMALNTQDRISGMNSTICKRVGLEETCATVHQKWSYAIPLEIIYLTPLSKWNPYEIEYHGWNGRNNIPEKDGRNGRSQEKALNGTSSRKYMITPAEFYTGAEVDTDAADTSPGDMYVLDRAGNPKRVRASGHRIMFPNIKDVGVHRQRYPIAPIHSEGNTMMKEIQALKDIVLRPSQYRHMFYEEISSSTASASTGTTKTAATAKAQVQDNTLRNAYFLTSPATAGGHIHELYLHPSQQERLKQGRPMTVFTMNRRTTYTTSHRHRIEIKPELNDLGKLIGLSVHTCDKKEKECPDGHGGEIRPRTTDARTFLGQQ